MTPAANFNMTSLFYIRIIFPISLFVYQSYILVDFHRDPPINVAYIAKSLVGSFMTPTKKLVQDFLFMEHLLATIHGGTIKYLSKGNILGNSTLNINIKIIIFGNWTSP